MVTVDLNDGYEIMLLLLYSKHTWYAGMQVREEIDATAYFNSELVAVLALPGNCCAVRAGLARRIQRKKA